MTRVGALVAICWALLSVLAASAFASHDPSRVFAGSWSTSFAADPTSGTITFRLVGDAEGAAAFLAAGATQICAEPSDYYRGTFTRGGDSGTHVACTATTGKQLYGRFHSNGFGTDGGYFITLSAPTHWTGNFSVDGVGGLDWEGTFVGHVDDDGAGDAECSSASRAPFAAAAINEVRIVRVTPSVEIRRGGMSGKWCDAEVNAVLQQGDEISCDPDGEVVLAFADNSTVTVRHSTQIKIASFFTEGGVVRTELLLRNGEISAKVNKSETTRSDFRVRAPTGGAGVRGTTFSVAYDPATRVTTTRVTDGEVEVQPLEFADVEAPAVPRGSAVVLSAGQEVQVSATAVGTIAAVGQSATPGASVALTKSQAVARVRQILRRNAGACGLATRWVKARATTNGVRVSARVVLAGKKGHCDLEHHRRGAEGVQRPRRADSARLRLRSYAAAGSLPRIRLSARRMSASS